MVGRKPILLLFSVLRLLTAYAALAWLVAAPTFTSMLMVLLWLSFLYGSHNGAMVVALTEIVPVEVRTAGFSPAYALAMALFGGFTPLVSTWLIKATGNHAAAGMWMALAGACGLVATIVVYSRSAVCTRALREGQMV
jgi:MHS family citrate/tricarballylate:H+ symporter-like MFS transporter